MTTNIKMHLPKLPPKAAYLLIDNPARRNALSLATLQSLHSQLTAHLTPPKTSQPLSLPPFQPSFLKTLQTAADKDSDHPHSWLVRTADWNSSSLPSVMVLRPSTAGKVFSSGHDLGELASLGPAEVDKTFSLCAELMTLLRHSPVPIVAAVDGLATAAGCQLALAADVTIASARSAFQLPGAALGLPCTSPAVALARRLPPGLVQRMLYTGEAVSAAELASVGAVEVVPGEDGAAFEDRLASVVDSMAAQAAQPRALAKWAYWTQVGMREKGDGLEDALRWAGEVMALHARGGDAREGMAAFLEKRKPVWKT
ncbi:hypothetical protein MCOR25_004839 [Pyricularia grisea]|uniref:Enoyl-CoA hydratase domain-containing protein 3, mitochondrial n=1 Tax=Pyricularia grisea TaxID=148305 RepID=A0A6P8B101_PYRGI|nr:uncharacterized protein PgNI_07358 [Pyricularia grisea]KAI6367763.1 hypothetical protein MCOR25_004839 [Pyricularia grisea]TLD08575.1 hypothetical protein PgNI_07358 [Pyricularia grisea]